jgi:Mg-chelatase subunit ChlI
MAKGRLPEGYISAQDLIKKFRKENPKAEISTAAQLLTAGEEAIIVVTASVSTGEAKSSGMSQGLLLDDKATEKAESSAIRRALVNLGYDSVESEDEAEEKEEKQEKKESRFGKAKREEPKEEEAEEDDEAEEEEEEKPRSRFGGKAAKEESEEEEESEEGQSRFKRGSRFQRS